VAAALKKFWESDFDVVLLDINLDRTRNPETANFLLELRIPFTFVSGYDTVTDRHHAHMPMQHKPFTDEQLGALLAQMVGPRVHNEMIRIGQQCLGDVGRGSAKSHIVRAELEFFGLAIQEPAITAAVNMSGISAAAQTNGKSQRANDYVGTLQAPGPLRPGRRATGQ
jgi:hypothetical protein